MGLSQEPFGYDEPAKYTFLSPSDKDFNPRESTLAASSISPSRSSGQDQGLIRSKDFSQHPDSYMVIPYGNTNTKTMSARTKSTVKWVRIVQLILRVCALLGALGLLVCVICISGLDSVTGWIIRVPPAVAILHTIYAIYHLARSSNSRTPASSASYMLFAAFIDASLIPFFVFAAMVSHTDQVQAPNTAGKWSTLFGSDAATKQVVESTFLLSVTNGGLHLASLVISLFLGVVFRKISRLSPDMNPLEDKLSAGHKRNKSDLSQASTAVSTTDYSEKADGLTISPTRNMPFMHTRNKSQTNLTNRHQTKSPYSPSKPNISRPIYSQPHSQRSSQQTLTARSPDPKLFNQASAVRAPDYIPQSSNDSKLKRSPTKASSVYSQGTDISLSQSTAPSLPEFNWMNRNSKNFISGRQSYQPVGPYENNHTSDEIRSDDNDENSRPRPKPLEMNPPTPPLSQQQQREQRAERANRSPERGIYPNRQPSPERRNHYANTQYRALAPTSGNHNWGPAMLGIGKARNYGNGYGDAYYPPTNTATAAGGDHAYSRVGKYPNLAAQAYPAHQNRNAGGGARVVSRSGIEVSSGGILPHGGVRAREVSGKVMEEGRGNWT